MKVFRRGDSPYWWVSATRAGKRRRWSTGLPHNGRKSPTRNDPVHDLLAGLRVREASVAHGLAAPEDDVPVSEWLETFITSRETSDSTREGYRAYVRALLSYPPARTASVRSWTYADSTRFLESRQDAVSVRRNLIRFLRAAWDEAQRRGIWIAAPSGEASRNPWHVTVRGEHQSPGRALSDAEILTLTGAGCPPWLRVAVYTSLLTGCRSDNVKSLVWSDIDLDDLTPDDPAALVRFRQSKTTRYSVPLHPDLRTVLLHWRETLTPAQRAAEAPVLPHLVGRSKSYLSAMFRHRRLAVGVAPCRFHDLRHTFNSRLAEAGVSKDDAMRLLNHRSRAVNDVYEHVEARSLASAVARVPASLVGG